MGIANKIELLINGGSVNQWARDHDLPPQTVHEWIKKDRMPRSAGLKTLVEATGIPKEWWLHGKGSPPVTSKHYPAKPLTEGKGEDNNLPVLSHSGTDIRVNNFITLPKYDLQTLTTEGYERAIHSEQVVDYLAFNKEWLDMSLNVRKNSLALIIVKDDSMEPTLRSDDLILTDVRRGELENNSIYVLQFDNELIVKRIQKKINGNVIVKSDNPNYESEELDELAARSLHIIGKVIWYGRRI